MMSGLMFYYRPKCPLLKSFSWDKYVFFSYVPALFSLCSDILTSILYLYGDSAVVAGLGVGMLVVRALTGLFSLGIFLYMILPEDIFPDSRRLSAHLDNDAAFKYSWLFALAGLVTTADPHLVIFWPWKDKVHTTQRFDGYPSLPLLQYVMAWRFVSSLVTFLLVICSFQYAIVSFFSMCFSFAKTLYALMTHCIKHKSFEVKQVPSDNIQYGRRQGGKGEPLLPTTSHTNAKNVDSNYGSEVDSQTVNFVCTGVCCCVPWCHHLTANRTPAEEASGLLSHVAKEDYYDEIASEDDEGYVSEELRTWVKESLAKQPKQMVNKCCKRLHDMGIDDLLILAHVSKKEFAEQLTTFPAGVSACLRLQHSKLLEAHKSHEDGDSEGNTEGKAVCPDGLADAVSRQDFDTLLHVVRTRDGVDIRVHDPEAAEQLAQQFGAIEDLSERIERLESTMDNCQIVTSSTKRK